MLVAFALLVVSACGSMEAVGQDADTQTGTESEFPYPEHDPIAQGKLPAMTQSEVQVMQDLRRWLEPRFDNSTVYELVEPESFVVSEPYPWFLSVDWRDQVEIAIPDSFDIETVNAVDMRGYEVSRMSITPFYPNGLCPLSGEFVIDEQGWIDFYAGVNSSDDWTSLGANCQPMGIGDPYTTWRYSNERFRITEIDDATLNIVFADGTTHTYEECDKTVRDNNLCPGSNP